MPELADSIAMVLVQLQGGPKNLKALRTECRVAKLRIAAPRLHAILQALLKDGSVIAAGTSRTFGPSLSPASKNRKGRAPVYLITEPGKTLLANYMHRLTGGAVT